MRRRGLVGAAMLAGGCLSEPAGVDPPLPPVIDAASVRSGPHNVLSAVVSVHVRHADSVTVRFRLDESTTGDGSETPAVLIGESSATIPVLSLLPTSRYALRVVAYGKGGTVVGDQLEFTTGALPSDLPAYTAGGPDPSPGYVVFAAGRYGLVIDNTGRVVWYRRFANGPGLNFIAQPTGRYLARPPTPEPMDLEPWLELDPLGDVVRTLGCAGNLQPRFHDLISQSDGGYWIMCDETRTMDLRAFGGVADARVTGTVLQHISTGGALLFHWSPFDHFAITDLEPADRAEANVNWTHGNALDFDADGNLIVSFRSLGEIT
ncbi:MAG: arylsulfotransferase family protein, partial [Gemmatimonadota bacterium]|nr:arylsulfotransferase family protein [Gemmatimonadota bacterium]